MSADAPSSRAERLRHVDMFSHLDLDVLERICRESDDVELRRGEVLFREGDPGDRAYVVTSGAVEVVKADAGKDLLLGVRDAGSVIGEMALLQEAPRSATVRARRDTVLMAISKRTLDELITSSPSAVRTMIRTMLDRVRETDLQLRRSQRMAQLGTLTAGVAHELNNPVAALRRAAQGFDDALERFAALAASVPVDGDGQARRRAFELLGSDDRPPPLALDGLARSDAQEEVERWLVERGVDAAWEIAPELVDAGIGPDQLEALAADSGDALGEAARFLALSSVLRHLARQVADGARRVSDIVGALKGYSFLDQAPVQDVDVRRGIEDTLLIVGDKIKGVRIVREFADDLPLIVAHGSELNQVWTNLIDNACDAMADNVGDKVLTLRAYRDGDAVVVEVEDNGSGIAPDVQARVFDTFFTTKAPGKGTGLGLSLTQRIVAEHGGSISVESEPGRTRFAVTLPIGVAEAEAEARDQPVTGAAPP